MNHQESLSAILAKADKPSTETNTTSVLRDYDLGYNDGVDAAFKTFQPIVDFRKKWGEEGWVLILEAGESDLASDVLEELKAAMISLKL